MWQVIEADDGLQHVVPYQDLKPHVTTRDCWCRPVDDNGAVVHNSMDRRERGEIRDTYGDDDKRCPDRLMGIYTG
jgi:hypothetical protein